MNILLLKEYFQIIANLLAIIGALVAISYKIRRDIQEAKKADTKVSEAEKNAFQTIPESVVTKTKELLNSQENLEQRTIEIEKIVLANQAALQMGGLFNLYNKQIERYQTETQSRAEWSFIFAIVAMVAGLAFVFWGGVHIIAGDDWQHVAAGSAISTIGGSISAYITKTFLDVHRLSISQLNHYFRQPVVNANILTAQRVADLISDDKTRQEGYQKILYSVIALIKEEGGDESHVSHRKPKPKKNQAINQAENGPV